jgi:hypothetical protein
MTLKIDKTGRILVPRQQGMILRQVSEKPEVMEEDGFLVHQGVAPRGFDWDRHIEEQREDSHSKVSML